ncbi:glucosamine-6-phosphate deaminase [Sodalis sp. dw_96]|uniref:glucosamine-6-phosphate deaminase n=1 Tax=Sodalis sp. dw_96 TaxID=2719794 RepID=UPI001BD1F030|nr:glucosamine-6-phosphate deaminase [Sodalis sp. dw_96]
MSLPLLTRRCEQLAVEVFADRLALGEYSAAAAADYLRQCLGKQENVRIIFAAAPSQNEFLAALAMAEGIDWSRVTAFHMDEYIGLPPESDQRFSHYLNQHLFERVHPGTVHLIPAWQDAERICRHYSALIRQAPIDMVCLGIGENGHLAFNDPPVADFQDPAVMKTVALDPVCRQQQVNDGCFTTLDAVPTHAVTLTIPALMAAGRLFCMVPGTQKRAAITAMLRQPVSTVCPATILRTHGACTLFTDSDAFGENVHG